MKTTIPRKTAFGGLIIMSLAVLTGCGQPSATHAARRHTERRLVALVQQYAMGPHTLQHWVNQLRNIDPTFQMARHWHAMGPAVVGVRLGPVRLAFRVVNHHQVIPANTATKQVWTILSSVFLVPKNDALSTSLGWPVDAYDTSCPTVRTTAAGGTLPPGPIRVRVSIPAHAVAQRLEFVLLNLMHGPQFLGAQTIAFPPHARTVSLVTNTQGNNSALNPTGNPNSFNWLLPNMGVGWPYETVVVDLSTNQVVGGAEFDLTFLPCTVFAPPKVPALPKGPPADTLPPFGAFRQALPNAMIPPEYYGKPWGVMMRGTPWWVVPFYQKSYGQYTSQGLSNGLALFDGRRLVWVLPAAWMQRETTGMGMLRVISAGARGNRLLVQFQADTVAASTAFIHVVDLTYQIPLPRPKLKVMAQYTG